ncbi:MAG: hypothetical protein AB7S68_01605 [Polyangiaceae bacterium]
MKHQQALELFREALGQLDVQTISPTLRQQLMKLWLRRAQNEHASVASFDRFCLGLLSVGAPPDLLERAHHAALDEVRHARLCFAVASRYAGDALGPGPLDLRGALGGALDADFSLLSLAQSTAIEGCLGETLSALEAERCAERATLPALKLALEIIATDEAEHAELAWAFLRFACETGGSEFTSKVRRILAPALHTSAESGVKYACADLSVSGYGFLDPAEAITLRREALAQVLIPAAKELGLA